MEVSSVPRGVDPETGEIVATGDDTQLTLFAGGPVPTTSVLALRSGKIEIPHELERGQELTLLVHARVDEVNFAGDVRKHVCAVVDMVEQDKDPQTGLFSATTSAFPPSEGGDEEPSFERGEDAKASDPDLDW